ncbi:STAS domain-containing protein [Georgenia alba]|uniref:STAS domain-containing protein n=1 Tax=Georgenia alba TaxID=2233858 RepID=A0ABW2QCQ1_9MICO
MIEISVSAATTTLAVVGDLDLSERDRFQDVSARLDDVRPGRLVVDLCRTEFVDSSGAAFLMSVGDDVVRDGGEAVLRGASDEVLFVLEICGALTLFQVDRGHRCSDA